MKIVNFFKKHWVGALLALGSLGLGLGIFQFLRRFRIKVVDVNFRNEETLYEHVRLIQDYHILESAKNMEDHYQYLNTMFLESKNLIILTSYFSRRIYEESYKSAELLEEADLNCMQDNELALPTIYCPDANIKKVTFIDGAVLYLPEHNVEFSIIEEGDFEQ